MTSPHRQILPAVFLSIALASVRLQRRVILAYYYRGILQADKSGNPKTLDLVTHFLLRSFIL